MKKFPVSKYRELTKRKSWTGESLGRLYVARIICENINGGGDAWRIVSQEEFNDFFYSMNETERKEVVSHFDLQHWLIATWANTFAQLTEVLASKEALSAFLSVFEVIALKTNSSEETMRLIAPMFNAISLLLERARLTLSHTSAFITAVEITAERIRIPEMNLILEKEHNGIGIKRVMNEVQTLNNLINGYRDFAKHFPAGSVELEKYHEWTRTLKPLNEKRLKPSMAACNEMKEGIKDLTYYRHYRPEMVLEKSLDGFIGGGYDE